MFLSYYACLLFSTSVSALSLLGMAFQILVVCMYLCMSYKVGCSYFSVNEKRRPIANIASKYMCIGYFINKIIRGTLPPPLTPTQPLEIVIRWTLLEPLETLPSFKLKFSVGFITSCYVIFSLSVVQAMDIFMIT